MSLGGTGTIADRSFKKTFLANNLAVARAGKLSLYVIKDQKGCSRFMDAERLGDQEFRTTSEQGQYEYLLQRAMMLFPEFKWFNLTQSDFQQSRRSLPDTGGEHIHLTHDDLRMTLTRTDSNLRTKISKGNVSDELCVGPSGNIRYRRVTLVRDEQETASVLLTPIGNDLMVILRDLNNRSGIDSQKGYFSPRTRRNIEIIDSSITTLSRWVTKHPLVDPAALFHVVVNAGHVSICQQGMQLVDCKPLSGNRGYVGRLADQDECFAYLTATTDHRGEIRTFFPYYYPDDLVGFLSNINPELI